MRTFSRYYKYNRYKVWSCPHVQAPVAQKWRLESWRGQALCLLREAGPVHGDVKPDFQNADN